MKNTTEKGFKLLVGIKNSSDKLSKLSETFETSTKDWHFNAIIGWSGQDLGHGFVESFYKSSKLMIEEGGAEWYDYYVYPIMFNYRHYIELALKDLLIKSQLYFGSPIEINISHDIEKTLQLLCVIIDKEKLEYLIPEQIRQFIISFYKQDQKNDRYRYPYDSKGNLTNNYDHSMINMKKIYESMEIVHEYLSSIRFIFDETSQNEILLSIPILDFVHSISSFKKAEELENVQNSKEFIVNIVVKEKLHYKIYMKLDNESVQDFNKIVTIPILLINELEGTKEIIGTVKYHYKITETNQKALKISNKKIKTMSIELKK